MNESKKAQDALQQIADIANTANPENGSDESKAAAGGGTVDAHAGCTIKTVPTRLAKKAAEIAMQVNPVNSPQLTADHDLSDEIIAQPQFLTLLTSKYWGPLPRRLTVSFMETTPADLRRRILLHMNAWNRTSGISFVETSGTGNVRISRGGGGYWSYLGTDILLIPSSRQTMNLQGFTMATPESEYKRVVRHETGHTMGFPHEHMRQEIISRIDPQKAYRYFLATYGWSRQMVDQQVLTPLSALSIMGTPADQTSIMCYQLPGSITRDGLPIPGGLDINATDYAFAGRVYPKLWSLTNKSNAATAADWPEDEDVPDQELEELIKSITSKSKDLELAG